MTSLCPNCGRIYCDCTMTERGQDPKEFFEDMERNLTAEEKEALDTRDMVRQKNVAKQLLMRRRQGYQVPLTEKQKEAVKKRLEEYFESLKKDL